MITPGCSYLSFLVLALLVQCIAIVNVELEFTCNGQTVRVMFTHGQNHTTLKEYEIIDGEIL